MGLQVLLYCPDRHLLYDGRTPEARGVGGGITARIRIGRALARRGHRVLHVGHIARRETMDDVEYVPLDQFPGAAVDVAVLTTSGGALDLTPARQVDIQASRTIVWAHGVDRPGGLSGLDYDALYAVSQFIADRAVEAWGVPAEKVLVSHNGYEPAHFAEAEPGSRDPRRLIYISHPSKGLAPALGVLARLRDRDPRYHLAIFGGEQLWGERELKRSLPDGAAYHGLVGQAALAGELMRSGFSLQLQNRPEPGALSIPEAQRAGCVIVASGVGVYPELVSDDSGGILIRGDAFDDRVQAVAAAAIQELVARPEALLACRSRSVRSARSVDETAAQWTGHWQQLASKGRPAA